MKANPARALLVTGCALSLLLFTGCEEEVEVEAPASEPIETEVIEPEAPETLGRGVTPLVDDSTEGAAEDGPGAGGGYEE